MHSFILSNSFIMHYWKCYWGCNVFYSLRNITLLGTYSVNNITLATQKARNQIYWPHMETIIFANKNQFWKQWMTFILFFLTFYLWNIFNYRWSKNTLNILRPFKLNDIIYGQSLWLTLYKRWWIKMFIYHSNWFSISLTQCNLALSPLTFFPKII